MEAFSGGSGEDAKSDGTNSFCGIWCIYKKFGVSAKKIGASAKHLVHQQKIWCCRKKIGAFT